MSTSFRPQARRRRKAPKKAPSEWAEWWLDFQLWLYYRIEIISKCKMEAKIIERNNVLRNHILDKRQEELEGKLEPGTV